MEKTIQDIKKEIKDLLKDARKSKKVKIYDLEDSATKIKLKTDEFLKSNKY